MLYLEPLYGDPAYAADLLRLARTKAQATGAPLTSAEGLYDGPGARLQSIGGRAPFEYCDGAAFDKLSTGSCITIADARFE